MTVVGAGGAAQATRNGLAATLDDLAREGGRERTWRRLDAHDLIPLVRASVICKAGPSVERLEPRSEKNTGRVAA